MVKTIDRGHHKFYLTCVKPATVDTTAQYKFVVFGDNMYKHWMTSNSIGGYNT